MFNGCEALTKKDFCSCNIDFYTVAKNIKFIHRVPKCFSFMLYENTTITIFSFGNLIASFFFHWQRRCPIAFAVYRVNWYGKKNSEPLTRRIVFSNELWRRRNQVFRLCHCPNLTSRRWVNNSREKLGKGKTPKCDLMMEPIQFDCVVEDEENATWELFYLTFFGVSTP